MKRQAMPQLFELEAVAAGGHLVLPASAELTQEEPAETWLSSCERYRYLLKKPLPGKARAPRKVVGFCMLNPSEGTAIVKDPTLGRVYEFAAREGGTVAMVGNLFNWRSAEPTDLLRVNDPVGPDAEAALERLAVESDLLIVAWGSKFRFDRRPPPIGGRAAAVLEILLSHKEEVYCLARTMVSGQPGHPLYLRGDAKLELYATRAGGIVRSG